MKVKIGVICFFSMQKEMVIKVADEFLDRTEILVDLGMMEGALDVARDMERWAAEVIVSWGSTAVLLEKEISTPVVSIRIPDFSIMRAVEQASKFSNKIIVMTHECVSGLEMLEELYGVDIKEVNFTNQNDFRYGAIQAFNEGFEVIIGKGYFTIDLAKEYGKKAVLLNYDIKSVRQAVQEAIRIALLRRKEREEYTRLETIFNSLTEGVVVTNNLGKITLFNRAAERILGIHAEEALGRTANLVLSHSRVNEALRNPITLDDEFLKIGNINIVASHKPINLEERILGVVSTIREASEIQKIHNKIRRQLVSKGFTAHYNIDHFSTRSLAMKKIIEWARKFAITDSSILITGESGTGKEVLAQSIHRLSLRSQRPFVAINCSVFPESLLESELFGYEEGAFTGAKKGGKTGLFELAHGGTLFLDEISTMPINLQSKLLRILQEREVMRLGGERLIPIDVRIISSTNRDLQDGIRKSLFREDLYFRLNVLAIRMPALRGRTEDISDLVSKFVSHFCKKYRKKEIPVSGRLLAKLKKYPWPGNVRELENVIERFVLLREWSKRTDSLIDEFLNYELGYCEHQGKETRIDKVVPKDNEPILFTNKTIGEQQKERIIRALNQANFSVTRAASFLGMSRSTFYRKLRTFDVR